MKVNLIVPPQPELRQPRAYINLGVAYLGAVLEEDGHAVYVVDLNEKNDIPSADVHGISAVTATHLVAEEISRELVSRGEHVVMGGIHPSIYPMQTLTDSLCNCVITGEGEYAFRDYLRDVPCESKIIKGGYIGVLDELPYPARHLFNNVVDYTGIHGQEKGVGATTVLSSRGCPYNCMTCTKIPQTSKVRFHSPRRIIREMKDVLGNYDVSHFRFVDDIFTINRKRIMKFCELALNEQLGATFICITRADALDSELLKNMSEAGCTEVHIGVESGSQRILDLMNKNISVQQLSDAIEKIKEAGIRAKAYLIYGYPSETKEDRQLTVDFVKHTQPDKVTVSSFTPLPGSGAWNFSTKKWFYPDGDEGYEEFKSRVEALCE